MNCKSCQNELANYLFDGAGQAKETVNSPLEEHLAACTECSEELKDLRTTIALLDGWNAPEPSPYFDQKMAVLLREEQAKSPANWFERLREHLLFNTGRQFRPAMAGVLALALVAGGGGYVGLSAFNQSNQVQASATVNDLQILDKNEQAIQQMDQLLQDDDSGDASSPAQPAS